MSDLQDGWVVCIGELFFGGLGTAYVNQACVGWVMTKIREHAQKFTSLEMAKSIADSLGGQVCRA